MLATVGGRTVRVPLWALSLALIVFGGLAGALITSVLDDPSRQTSLATAVTTPRSTSATTTSTTTTVPTSSPTTDALPTKAAGVTARGSVRMERRGYNTQYSDPGEPCST